MDTSGRRMLTIGRRVVFWQNGVMLNSDTGQERRRGSEAGDCRVMVCSTLVSKVLMYVPKRCQDCAWRLVSREVV